MENKYTILVEMIDISCEAKDHLRRLMWDLVENGLHMFDIKFLIAKNDLPSHIMKELVDHYFDEPNKFYFLNKNASMSYISYIASLTDDRDMWVKISSCKLTPQFIKTYFNKIDIDSINSQINKNIFYKENKKEVLEIIEQYKDLL